jgi:hypothetical protein
MKKALVQMQGIFAELDKSLLIQKLKKAREQKKKETGRCEGRIRYGEFNRDEKKIVNKIGELRFQGFSCQAIANRLNAEGHRTRYGKYWISRSISRILKRKEQGYGKAG